MLCKIILRKIYSADGTTLSRSRASRGSILVLTPTRQREIDTFTNHVNIFSKKTICPLNARRIMFCDALSDFKGVEPGDEPSKGLECDQPLPIAAIFRC